MVITLDEACNVLHVDRGADDILIDSLIDAVGPYIEVATGFPESLQASDSLCTTVAGLLLTQWYYADHADDRALTRTINALFKVITIRARDIQTE